MKAIIRLIFYVFPIAILLGRFVVFYGSSVSSFFFSIVFPIIIIFNLLLIPFLFLKRNKLFLFPLIGIIIFFLCFDSFLQLNFRSNGKGLNSLSILTYNTKGFLIQESEGEIADFILDNNPDIILFQEFSAIKYKHFIKDYPYWVKTNGMAPEKSVLAVFSKYPIVDKDVFKFPSSKNNAMYIDIDYNGDSVRIYNLHLESFGITLDSELSNVDKVFSKFSRISQAQKKRKKQVNMLKTHMENYSGNIIISGDFNSTQYSATYSKLKKDRKDSFIEKGMGLGETYSLLCYPLRLDFILVDKNFEVLSHQNFKLGFSDHEPVMARLKLK